MSVLEPRPNPETVSALLDTGWRVAEAEAGRTDSLDRKTATLASFASILVSIAAVSAASVGDVELPAPGQLVVVIGLVGAITLLTGAVVVAVVALLPQEHTGLGTAFVEGLATWREVRKSPDIVMGRHSKALWRWWVVSARSTTERHVWYASRSCFSSRGWSSLRSMGLH